MCVCVCVCGMWFGDVQLSKKNVTAAAKMQNNLILMDSITNHSYPCPGVLLAQSLASVWQSAQDDGLPLEYPTSEKEVKLIYIIIIWGGAR